MLTFSFGQKYWIGNFYLKRIRRILPVLLVVLVATFIAGLFILLPFELKQLGRQIFFGGLFSGNLHFWSETGYFDSDAIRKPLLHLWSLGVEEQFYIVYPLIILFAMKFGFRILNVLIVVFFVSFFLMIASGNDPAMVYYSPFTRAWELVIGGIASSVRFNLREATQRILRAIGVILLISAFFFTKIGSAYPNFTTVFGVFGTCLILIFVRDRGSISRVLSSRLFVFFGKLSYSLYLWHWPILSLFVISVGFPPGRQEKYLMFLVAVTLAYFSFRAIENPFLRIQVNRKRILPILFSTILLSLLGLIVSLGSGFPSRIDSSAHIEISQSDVSEQFNTVEFSNPECLIDFPNEDASEYQWWFCRTNNSNDPQILLWGNSYANQYFHGFSSNSKLGNYSILSIGDCPIQREQELLPPNPCAGFLFDEQRQFIKDLVVNQSSINTVVIAGLKDYSDEASKRDLGDALAFLEKEGKQVIVFHPHIRPSESIFGCVSRPFRSAAWDCALSSNDYSKLIVSFKPTLEMIQKDYPNVKTYNPNNAFCNRDGCSFMISGLPIIRDGSGHMSDWGSELVARDFVHWLGTNGLALAQKVENDGD